MIDCLGSSAADNNGALTGQQPGVHIFRGRQGKLQWLDPIRRQMVKVFAGGHRGQQAAGSRQPSVADHRRRNWRCRDDF
jgi:hypothetical protein